VIERYKSGFEPPGDFPFDDLSRGGESTPLILPGSGNTYVSSGVGAHRSESMTVKGTMSAGKLKKRVGLFAIFSSNKVYIIMHRNYLQTFMTTIITFNINYYVPSIWLYNMVGILTIFFLIFFFRLCFAMKYKICSSWKIFNTTLILLSVSTLYPWEKNDYSVVILYWSNVTVF